jgi:Rha family phage regulatory protein
MEKVEILKNDVNTDLMPVRNEIVFTSEQGVPVTTSLKVAEIFGKEHADVLKAIRKELSDMPDNHHAGNFAYMVEMRQLPQGGSYKSEYYLLTKNGFTAIVLGFTGAKAKKFKWDYIDAFDKMEAALKDIILNKNKELMEINKKQEEQLLKQAPIIKEHKIFMESETLYTTTEVAMNLINTSAEKVHDILLARGVIKRHSEGHYMLTVKYSGKGYGVIVEKPVKIGRKIQIKKTLKWTNKGRGLIYGIMHSVNLYQPQLGIWSEEVMDSLVVNN